MFCCRCGAELPDGSRVCEICNASQVKIERQWVCPYCKEIIIAGALKCKHCGEMLDSGIRASRAKADFNPGLAAVFSFIFPGLGQIYKGQVGKGIVWFIAVVVGYGLLVIPGLVLHIICIVDAHNAVKV